MLPRSGGYAQKTTLVGTRVSDDEDPQGLAVFLDKPADFGKIRLL